jgi:tetratricopeptide (TPR) repeat protein
MRYKTFFLFISFSIFIILSYSQETTSIKGNELLKIGTIAPTANGEKYALIVGVSSYLDKNLNKLNYAHTDAKNFRDFLLKGYVGKINKENIKFLIEEKAVYDSFNAAIAFWLKDVRKKVKKGDEIYIYYSGHGIISAEGQNLMCRDSEITDPNLSELDNNIALTIIRSMVSQVVTEEKGVKVYYILDACRKNDNNNQSLNTANKVSSKLVAPGEYFFYAASEDQFSYESNKLDKGNGLFTYFLLLGLQGAADTNPVDNRISIDEIKRFVTRNVEDFSLNVLKTSQQPFFPIEKEIDRQRIISVLPKDTVAKYKEIYNTIKNQLLASFKKNQKVSIEDINKIYASKGWQSNVKKEYEAKPIEINTTETFIKNSYFLDSVNNEIYLKFMNAIHEKQLVEPEGKSAFDYYKQLEKNEINANLLEEANQKLFIALTSKTQKLIDNYLRGKSEDRSKKTFDLAFKEIKVADNILESDNPYRNVLKPKLYFLQARALAGSNNPRDWDKGIQIIDSALNVAPNAAYSYYTKAILFESKHRFFTAIKFFTKAIELAPNWIYAQYNMAEAYFKVSEFAKSISLCRQIITKDLKYSDAYSLLATNYENVKMYDSAIYWNQKALEVDSLNITAYKNLSRIYLKGNDFSQEKTNLSNQNIRIAAFQFNDAEALTVLGKKLEESKQFDSAASYYLAALHNNPFYINAIESYAILLWKLGKEKQAESLYSNAIKSMGNDSRILASYLNFKFQQSEFKAAEKVFYDLIGINHEDPSVFINYYKLLENNYELIHAKNILHLGLSYIPTSPSLVYNLANFYFKHHNNSLFNHYGLDSSLFYFRKSRTMTPNYSFTHFGLYQVYLTSNNADSALQSLQYARFLNQYIQTITNYNPDIISLADKSLKAKDYNLAIKYFKLAISFNDEFKSNWKLALCFYLDGQLENAEKIINNISLIGKTKTQVKEIKQLLGNILFDQKKYNTAFKVFKEIDDKMNPFPNYLEQAACLFNLNKPEDALQLFEEGKKNDATAIKNFIELEGLRYSKHLIETIKKL